MKCVGRRINLGVRQKMQATFQSARDKYYFHFLVAQFLAQILAFATVLLVAKILSPTEFGTARIIQAYAALFFILGEFGIGPAMFKTTSEKRLLTERYEILKASVLRLGPAIAFSFLLLAALSMAGIAGSGPRLQFWILVYACSIPFVALSSVLTQFLQAQKEVRAVAAAQILVRLQSFVLVVTGTWLWGFRGFIMATVLAFALGLWPVIRKIEIRKLLAAQQVLPPGFMKLAVFAMMSAILIAVGHSGDIYILDHYAVDRAQVGYYALAAILVQGMYLIVHSIGVISAPYFSERSHNLPWVRQKLLQTQWRATVVSVAGGSFLFACAWLLIPIVYGESYSAVLGYLAVLLLKNVIVSSYTVVRMALGGLGKMDLIFVTFAVVTPVGLGLAYIMLERYGILGVAWAQCITSAVALALLYGMSAYWLRGGRPTKPV
jgi:O-antigen/teichoic acid export membrane protein